MHLDGAACLSPLSANAEASCVLDCPVAAQVVLCTWGGQALAFGEPSEGKLGFTDRAPYA